MSDRAEGVLVACAVMAAISLACIVGRLCEMEPAVTVQFVPQPESSGDKAAVSGSE